MCARILKTLESDKSQQKNDDSIDSQIEVTNITIKQNSKSFAAKHSVPYSNLDIYKV